jgi:hypothetical protein
VGDTFLVNWNYPSFPRDPLASKTYPTVNQPLLADATRFNAPSAHEKIDVTENQWKPLIVPILALLLTGYFAIVQLSKWPGRLSYPGEEDAAEGTQLSEMIHLRRGIEIYRVPIGGTFDSAIYGPLCYVLGAAVVNSDKPTYLPLRLLSLAASAGLVVLCSFFVFRLTNRKVAGLLACFMLLASAYFGRYGISARADMVALLLSFSGFLIFYLYRDSRTTLIISAILMLLSFFYKQQFVGAPTAVCVFLLMTRRYRQTLEFVLTLAAGGLFLIAVFSFVVFPHQAFLDHFLAYNHLPFAKELVLPEILMFVVPLFVPLLGSADLLDNKPDQLLTCYAGISAGAYFLLLLSSGPGADTNRCLEAMLVLTCLLAARIASAESIFSGFAWTGALALTLSLVALLGVAFTVPEVRSEDFSTDSALQNYLRNKFHPGTPVLGYYAADPMRAGLEAPITNLWHYSQLIRTGMLSDHDILSRINNGGYGAILLDFDLASSNSSKKADFYTTPSMRNAMLQHYMQIDRLELPAPEFTRFTDGSLYVWVPRPASGAGGNSQ